MLTGSLVAIATPMQEGGALDLPALRKLIDFHIANGTAGIVIVGTTGESPTVDFDEHCLLIKTAVDHAGGPHPGGRGHRRQFDARGDRTRRLRGEGRRQRAPVGRALLQQADAGRPLSPFPRDCGKRRAADDPVQRARTHGRGSRHRDDAAAGRRAGHRRDQGRDRRHGSRQRAAARAHAGGARRICRVQRRRHHRAAADAAGRPRRDFGHRQRRAEADGADVRGGARRAT